MSDFVFEFPNDRGGSRHGRKSLAKLGVPSTMEGPGPHRSQSSSKKYLRPILRQINTKLSASMAEKMAKRVIAPYVMIEKRGQKVTLKRAADTYNFYLTKKSSLLMKNLSAFMTNFNDLPGLLYETGDIMKSLTESLGVRLYFVDNATDLLHQYQKHVKYPRCRVDYEIMPGKSVASYVAYTKEYVCVDDVTRDTRFPNGVTYKENVKPVLCVPIVVYDNCFAVLEFYRDMYQPPYGKNELKLVVLVCGWVGLAIQQNKDGVILHKKQEVNDDLLHLVLAYFAKLMTFENLLGEILSYTKNHLNAERGVIYIITTEDDQMFADVYEDGIADEKNPALIKKKLRVSIGLENTVASMVAQTGELMNVKDVYNDPRFAKDVVKDNNMKVINRAELCVPIKNHSELLGIITIINKKGGLFFTQDDEALIKIIATYSCMALQHATAIRDNDISQLKIQQTLDLLHYHFKPCEHSLLAIEEEYVVPKNIREFSWYIIPDDVAIMPHLYIYMMTEIVGEENIDMDELKHFILTVQRSYRSNPYHNFDHAFNVSHCMYAILLRNKYQFSLLEREALLVATILHDIDHGGVTNNFLLITNHILTQLYHNSPWENHHVFVAMRILAKYRIFNNLTNENYEEFLDEVKWNILSTDLVYYFKARTKMIPLIQQELFDIGIPEHMNLAKKIIMTMCDMSGQIKPFSISKKITDGLYMEFYAQGDNEKNMGVCPLPTIDRDHQNIVPDDQVQFITIVVMSCAQLMKEILTDIDDIYANAELLRDSWKRIIQLRGTKMWRQCDSIIQ